MRQLEQKTDLELKLTCLGFKEDTFLEHELFLLVSLSLCNFP